MRAFNQKLAYILILALASVTNQRQPSVNNDNYVRHSLVRCFC